MHGFFEYTYIINILSILQVTTVVIKENNGNYRNLI